MEICYLADRAEAIPQLAAWFRAEWPDMAGADAEAGFRRCVNKHRIPIGFVATEAEVPLGTVQLLSSSVSSHAHLAPWVGGLYVVPASRHRGIATRLVDHAVAKAGELGHTKVYIGLTRARDYYESCGWRYEDDGDANGEAVTILSKAV